MAVDLVFKIIEYTLIGIRKVIEKRKEKKARSRFAKKIEDIPIVLVQIGREIINDVRDQLGEPSAIISRLETLEIHEMHLAATECYEAIIQTAKRAREEGYNRIVVVLSGPVVLNFILGQILGFHLDIDLAYWDQGEYVVIPSAGHFNVRYEVKDIPLK